MMIALLLLAGSWKTSLPVDVKPSHILAADLNADGRPDLVVAGERDGLAVYLNQGGGRFTTGARVKDAGAPSELAALDFNGDGHLDIATAEHDTFRVMIFAGDGRGGLKALETLRAKATGRPHVHGLLAQGGNLVFFSSEEGEMIPLRPADVPAVKTSTPWNPTMGDVNGDGRPDVVAGSFEGNEITVWLGGASGFKAPARHRVFPRVFTTKLADLNGDGHLDIYACHDDHGRVTVLYGDGKGGFQQMAGSPLDVGQEAYGVQAFDADGDGRLDLLAMTLKGELLLFRQTAKGVFAVRPVTWLTGAGGYRMTAADFDGPRLAIADPDKRLIWFLRPRGATEAAETGR